MYVSLEAVEFRRKAKSIEEAQEKMQQLVETGGRDISQETTAWSGIMICEQAAKRQALS